MEGQDNLMLLLGLTEYEGKVYRALLSEFPATAYRLGKRSGVPQSRVYEVANRLVEKGAAIVESGDPARYAPVPPETLVNGARNKAARQLDALAAELSTLFKGGEASGHAWIRGANPILNHLTALASAAKSEILLAAAPSGQEALVNALDSSAVGQRGRILTLPTTDRSDTAFVLLIDSEIAVIGRLGPDADALSTRHPIFTRLCNEYFRLRSIADAAQDVLTANRPPRSTPREWLDWEEEKQRRLLHVH